MVYWARLCRLIGATDPSPLTTPCSGRSAAGGSGPTDATAGIGVSPASTHIKPQHPGLRQCIYNDLHIPAARCIARRYVSSTVAEQAPIRPPKTSYRKQVIILLAVSV